ncbi:MAG: PilZ domain-containing protein [Proteobacteria bacterium]|nr:PilZ domain-containing protein [Pseudomonadota bacterium]
MLVLTGMGIFINLYPETSPIVDQGFFPVAAYWACVNMITLSLVTLMSIEHPRWRTEERFITQKDCQVLFEGKKITIHLFDISMSGAQFSLDTSLNLNPKDTITLKIPNVGKLESWVVKVKKHTVHVHFKPMDEKKRDNLLRYLFTGTHDNKVELTSHFYLLKRIIKRAFGHHEHLYKTKPSALSSHLSEN